MFGVDVYRARRKRLQEQVSSSGILVFLGNDESPMNYKDNPYHFCQDSTFLYFFGLSYAGLAAVIDLEEGKETIFGDELTVDDIVWMGTQPALKEKSLKIGVENTAPSAQLRGVLQDVKAKGRTIHFLPPYRAEHTLKLMNLFNISFEDAQKSSIDFVKAVVKQRNIKSDEEIVELDKAASVSADMHLAAYKMARPGITEYAIASKVQQVAKDANCELSFPIIATINGQTLHNHYHGNVLKSGGMFLLDAGAQTPSGYAGDLSSTMPIDPKFTDRQKEIYQIAYNAHEAAIAMLKPGTKFKDVHLTTCKTIAAGMKEMGLMKGDVDEAVARGAHALFFQCGTGQMMGMDVHDMGVSGTLVMRERRKALSLV